MDREAMDLEAVESDARQDRMDRVAVLYAEITAATREFLRALAESDRHGDWAEAGFASCADWLVWRIGVTRMTASEKVRAARALEDLPLISEAMDRGDLSFSKVRALTRVATPENEAELLAFARAGSTASLERLVRGWKSMDRAGEQRVERLRHRMRSFSVFPDGEGMYLVRGRLTPEVAAVLMRAVEAASDALFAGSSTSDSGEAGCSAGRGAIHAASNEESPDPEQRRADAVGLLAERALAAGFGGEDAPISGSRAERYQVVLHMEPETLRAQGEPGMSELRTALDFQLKSLDGSRATPPSSKWRRVRTARCSTSGAEAARSRPRSGAHSRPGTEGVGFPAADSASPTRTTSNTGRTAARRA